ncbi:transmembrane protein 26, partial [Biomphalaria pfeifferi]
EKTVRENPLLTIVILSLWTASLMQFTLVVTATKSKKSRASVAMQVTSEGCCPVEVISIFISVLLQDGPFLVLRMLLIFRYDVLSYTNIFFTCKNSLVLVLQ